MASMFDVYITKTGKFLPNDPVSNDRMEDYLGRINDAASKARRLVLKNNGIESRHYALDEAGKATHNNAEMTALAVQSLLDDRFTAKHMELLSCGTSTPDSLLPSHASMVHGLLKNKPMELNSASGICCAGMSSMKYAYMSVKSGNSRNGICTGSERVSTWMKAEKYDAEADHLASLSQKPVIAFKKDFLRWMLSDGAGALLLENKPAPNGISLRIEWIEALSHAHDLETCMYAGGDKRADGSIKPWSDYSPEEWLTESVFAIKQDTKLLDEFILVKGAESVEVALGRHGVQAESIDFLLPHISSYYFAPGLEQTLLDRGIHLPREKWFMNLKTVGNVGSASIYLALDALMASGKLRPGHRILLSVPESGRFTYAYALLTVV